MFNVNIAYSAYFEIFSVDVCVKSAMAFKILIGLNPPHSVLCICVWLDWLDHQCSVVIDWTFHINVNNGEICLLGQNTKLGKEWSFDLFTPVIYLIVFEESYYKGS